MKGLEWFLRNVLGSFIIFTFFIGIVVILEEFRIAEFAFMYNTTLEELMIMFMIFGSIIFTVLDLDNSRKALDRKNKKD